MILQSQAPSLPIKQKQEIIRCLPELTAATQILYKNQDPKNKMDDSLLKKQRHKTG